MATYRTALISFIDILGFRNIVDSRSCEDISSALKAMRHFSEGDDSGEEMSAKVVQFSDSIIRIRPLDSKINEEAQYGALFHELSDIGMMQGDLANNNIYLRGGLTLGEISYEENRIFGPGFIRAYDLESKIASHPRIIVDCRLLTAMKSDPRLYSAHNGVKGDLGYIARQIKRGTDGLHHVDYLRVTINNMDDPIGDAPNFLRRHKANILKNIRSVSELDPESAKYLWAAIYHNEYLDREVQKNKGNKDLWISDNELPLLESPIE
jgi:hypothetical protein